MRKLTVASFVSLDGVIEAPWTWVGSYFDEECQEYAYEKLAGVDYFLLGRVTYESFSSRWPQVKGDKYMDRINGLKKLVASRTLKDLSWNASLITGEVASELARIKREPGGNVMKYGISALDRTLIAHKLVDEYQLWVVPKCVGEGKRAFQDVDPSLLNLELVDTRRFRNSTIMLTYAPR